MRSLSLSPAEQPSCGDSPAVAQPSMRLWWHSRNQAAPYSRPIQTTYKHWPPTQPTCSSSASKSRNWGGAFPSMFGESSHAATRRAAILGSAAAFQPSPKYTSSRTHSLFKPALPEAGLCGPTTLASTSQSAIPSHNTPSPLRSSPTTKQTDHFPQAPRRGCSITFRKIAFSPFSHAKTSRSSRTEINYLSRGRNAFTNCSSLNAGTYR